LEDQLLSITIDIEQPELERRKQELIEGENNLKIKLNELEKSLLTQLAQDDSDILENKELIANLDLTKSKTLEINNSLEESKKLTDDIEVQRSNYKNLSIIGSRIYLASKELINLNHMYQFGLNQ
jgi:dynein heavy chain 2